MPKLLLAHPPLDAKEEHQIRRLAGSRHAPADWILRATMIVGSWERTRTTTIATKLRCHPQTVRERIIRFNAEGLDGLGDRPGAGRKPRLTEQERGTIIALARSMPPGRAERMGDELRACEPEKDAQWSLDALARAAHDKGIQRATPVIAPPEMARSRFSLAMLSSVLPSISNTQGQIPIAQRIDHLQTVGCRPGVAELSCLLLDEGATELAVVLRERYGLGWRG